VDRPGAATGASFTGTRGFFEEEVRGRIRYKAPVRVSVAYSKASGPARAAAGARLKPEAAGDVKVGDARLKSGNARMSRTSRLPLVAYRSRPWGGGRWAVLKRSSLPSRQALFFSKRVGLLLGYSHTRPPPGRGTLPAAKAPGHQFAQQSRAQWVRARFYVLERAVDGLTPGDTESPPPWPSSCRDGLARVGNTGEHRGTRPLVNRRPPTISS